jgi:hypothetical protein
MIVDQFLRVSTAQAVTTTAVSTDKIDLLQAREIGEGADLFFVFTDDNASLSSPTVIAATAAIVTASLTAGAQFMVPIPPQVASLGERYLGAQYTVSGTYSAGTVTADVVHNIQDGRKFYASGFSV